MEKLNSNLILCLPLKIGYSKYKYLKYTTSINWSIEFYFDIEDMHSSDLFLIIFSYLKYNDLYCLDVYTLAKSNNSKKIFSRKSGYDLNKMTYREFEVWWENRQWYDSILLDSKEIYGIRLCFVPELVKAFLSSNKINLEIFQLCLKPNYPWNLKIISYFDYFLDESNEDVFWEKPSKYRWYSKIKPIKKNT